MSEQSAPVPSSPPTPRIMRGFEYVLFNSRWLMAPFYVGLVVALAVLLLKFVRMLWEFVLHAAGYKSTEVILDALALIDVTLVANLILIVVFSGYENFVSRIDTSGNPNWPIWITKIDFAGLKQKLLASIVAISAIHVLEAFLNIDAAFDATRMTWLVAVHLVFVISALLLALSDRWGGYHGDE
ncbi:TIGR00645 family protein [Bradyrhizobium sp. ma5]|uniref:TIGR00645 family protein n=1 Tax=unclassified Bradyrhizobium TaxID=2631580 RepID=UPI001CC3F68F|nr:TIGR00645 family protein [Bradyrhizobium sp. RD5-C2]